MSSNGQLNGSMRSLTLVYVLCAPLASALPMGTPAPIDCTFRTPSSQAYNITISNWLKDDYKLLTCDQDTCSSGTHKYIHCESHIAPTDPDDPTGSILVSIDQGVHYLVFHDLKVQSTLSERSPLSSQHESHVKVNTCHEC